MEEVGIALKLQGRRELAAGLQEGEQGFDQLGQAAEAAGKKGESSGRRFDRTRSILGSVGRGLLFGAKAAGAMAVAAGAVGIKTAASMQTARIGFTTMLGSAQKAGRFLRDLSGFAAKTPFGFPELQTAASRLVSAGVETNKVIPIMTTLGDVTAGMGTGSEGITRATNAIQQMTAAGRISAEDLNQLRDAGIPVYDLLASALGKTKAEVIALKDEGKLGGDALTAMMRALETGKGLERFNGLMEKQSKTLNGRWSTLKDTVTMGLADAVKPALPLVKDLLVLATDLATGAMPKIQSALKTGAGAVRTFVDAWKGGGMDGAMSSLSAPGVPAGASAIGGSLGDIGNAIKDVDWGAVKDGLAGGVADTVSVFSVAIGFAADNVDKLAKYLPALIAGFVLFKAAQALSNVVALVSIPLTAAQVVSNFALAAAMRAQTAATATATVAQRGLNLALLANPLGLVIAALVLIAGALYMAYQKSETFRALVDLLFNNLLKPLGQFIGGVLLDAILTMASGWLRMAEYAVMGFRILATAAFRAFDGILAAAEAGLGWIPGIGDKIKGARTAFNEFGDGVISKLAKVEQKLRDTRGQVDELARDRSSTITISTIYSTRNLAKEADPRMNPSGVANGGHVRSGQPYIVGERRAELFVPSVSGRIVPRVPDSPAALADLDPGAFDGTPMGGGRPRRPLVVPVYLNGREIAEAVVDDINDVQARQ